MLNDSFFGIRYGVCSSRGAHLSEGNNFVRKTVVPFKTLKFVCYQNHLLEKRTSLAYCQIR